MIQGQRATQQRKDAALAAYQGRVKVATVAHNFMISHSTLAKWRKESGQPTRYRMWPERYADRHKVLRAVSQAFKRQAEERRERARSRASMLEAASYFGDMFAVFRSYAAGDKRDSPKG